MLRNAVVGLAMLGCVQAVPAADATAVTIRNPYGTFEYQNGHRIRATLRNGITVRYVYDKQGRFDVALYSNGKTHKAVRDSDGRLLSIDSSDGRKLLFDHRGGHVTITRVAKDGTLTDLTRPFERAQQIGWQVYSDVRRRLPVQPNVTVAPGETGCGGDLDAGGGGGYGCEGGGEGGASGDGGTGGDGGRSDGGTGGDGGKGDGGGGDTGGATEGDAAGPGPAGPTDSGDGDDDFLPETGGDGEGAPQFAPGPPQIPRDIIERCLATICRPADRTFSNICSPLADVENYELCWKAATRWYLRCVASCVASGDFIP